MSGFDDLEELAALLGAEMGAFVPVPPGQTRPPATGGRKMRIQSFEEARAELAEGRAEIARQGARQARSEVEDAREARRGAKPSGF
jgi:hypothetical protein